MAIANNVINYIVPCVLCLCVYVCVCVCVCVCMRMCVCVCVHVHMHASGWSIGLVIASNAHWPSYCCFFEQGTLLTLLQGDLAIAGEKMPTVHVSYNG